MEAFLTVRSARPALPLQTVSISVYLKNVKEARKGFWLMQCLRNDERLQLEEGYLMVWATYMSPWSSIFGLLFKCACDVI